MKKACFYVPLDKTGGAIVDWDFQSIIHCLKWYKLNGYVLTTINNRMVAMHRLLLKFPNEVDHINHIKHDNRLINLKNTTHRENAQNRSKKKILGASINYMADRGKFKLQMMFNKKLKHIGYYPDHISAQIIRDYITEAEKSMLL